MVDIDDPSNMTIGEFVIWYLGNHKRAYVHQMLDAFNELRKNSPTKRQMKYSSFRTIVWNLKTDGYIKSVGKKGNGDDPFEKSYYALTGKLYTPGIRGRPQK